MVTFKGGVASYTTDNTLSKAMWDNYPYFFFLETNTHTREREKGSNTKAHHNSIQKRL